MKISTSILNSSDRIESVIKLNRTNTSYIHVDVMDGNFVSDTQFKINEIRSINFVSKYPLDIHLMVDNPIKYIDKLNDMNISYITFHLEVNKEIRKIIDKIKELGYKVGISIKPNTDIEEIIPYLEDIDMVLIMSVEPGLGGQKFLSGTINKINKLRKIIKENNYKVLIEVDGGINDETIKKLTNVDIAVVGSYITKSDNYYMQVEKLLSFFKKSKKEVNFKKNILMTIEIILIIIFSILVCIKHLKI